MSISSATDVQAAAIDWIFRAEGGLVDDPADPGGITHFGVSLRYLRRQGAIGDIDGDGDIDADDIRSMTREQASEFYLRDFWHACRCDDLPPGLALAVFDAAVNSGTPTASRLLQEVLRVKNDGIIGPVTVLAALHANDPLPRYLARRAQYYSDVIRANSTLARFFRGWLNRLFLLQRNIHLYLTGSI